jgi:hypothetical protein
MPISADAFDKWIGAMVSLLQPSKVCDIGPGAGKYGKMIKKAAARGGFTSHVTAIEIDASYVEEYGLRSIYDEIIIDDAINIINTPQVRFDLVMIGDCIEHMRKSSAIDLLNFLVYRSSYICVVYPEKAIQDAWQGHAAEAHISTWSAEDFKGWNSLHKTVDHPWCKMHLSLIKGYQRSRLLTDADIVALERRVDAVQRQTSQSASPAQEVTAEAPGLPGMVNLPEPGKPLGFDEEWYLSRYPDIALAVREGRIPSGLVHYERHGKSEGRLPAAPAHAAEEEAGR